MKVVILAGGLGTRISEETQVKPKPMVEIGGKPILWHIMKIYSHFGFNEFIICLGYKGEYIKDWFNSYYLNHSDITFDSENNKIHFHKNRAEKWKVTLVDTGDKTMTGGRVSRIKDYVGDETFMMTYGDGVADIDINELVKYHKQHGKLGTMTAVIPEGRFGSVNLDDNNNITSFGEKKDNQFRVSGGFFVFEPEVFNYIKEGDDTIFEREPLETMASSGVLKAFLHTGFWKPMDTLSDKIKLEALWNSPEVPWKVWDKKVVQKVKALAKLKSKKKVVNKTKNKAKKGLRRK